MASETYSSKISAALSAMKSYEERPFVKHQWEELVQQMSRMNDPRMREMAYREMDSILKKDPCFKLI